MMTMVMLTPHASIESDAPLVYDDSLHLQAYRAKHVGGYSIWSHVYGLAQSEYALPEKT